MTLALVKRSGLSRPITSAEHDTNLTAIETATNAVDFTGGATGAVARSLQLKAGDVISVKDFGAKGDGVTDDTAAIQAAINALKASTVTQPVDVTQRLYLPTGDYKVSAPLLLYSGVTLVGDGGGSRLVDSGAIASGRGIVEMTGQAASGHTWVVQAGLRRLGLRSTTQGVRAVKQNVDNMINCEYRDLLLDVSHGLILDGYCQNCRIVDIVSIGSVDQILRLAGNWNHIDRIDKEGSTGTTSEPYVELVQSNAGSSHGNKIGRLLIEGNGSVNKAVLKIDTMTDVHLDSLWCEASPLAKLIALDNGADLRVGRINNGFPGNLIALDHASNIRFDHLDASGQDMPIKDLPFTLTDAASTVLIDFLVTRRADNNSPKGQITIRRHRISGLVTSPLTDILPEFDEIFPGQSENLLSLGGSFESAADADSASGGGWIYPTSTFSAITYVNSEINIYPQKMFNGVITGAPGSKQMRQLFTVGAGSVGRIAELCGWSKVVGSAVVVPALAGLNFPTQTGYSRNTTGDGTWVYHRLRGRIGAAGTLNVVIWILSGANGDVVNLDAWKCALV